MNGEPGTPVPAFRVGAAADTRAAMLPLVLSLTVIAALALIAGAYFLWRRTGSRKQPLLMLLLALIAFANIAIWTVPDSSGDAPLTKVERGAQ